MSNFIKVTEARYGDNLLLNIESIAVINTNASMVLVNGIHGENTGWYTFEPAQLKKILVAIGKAHE